MKKLNKKGFTLVELIVVIVIIGILAAILIPNLGKWIEKARQKAAESEAVSYIRTDVADGSSEATIAALTGNYIVLHDGYYVVIEQGALVTSEKEVTSEKGTYQTAYDGKGDATSVEVSSKTYICKTF